MTAANAVADTVERLAEATDGRAAFVGCTDEEIQQVIGANGTFTPGGTYLEFLRRMGKWAGSLFMGTDIFYPKCLDAPTGLDEELSSELISALGPRSELFIFASHQGYQYYFFRCDSPGVYMCDEATLSPAQTLEAPSFADFLIAATDAHLRFLANALHDPRITVPLRPDDEGVFFDSTQQQ